MCPVVLIMLRGLSKQDVNMRYMEWWKDQNIVSYDAVKRKCDKVRTDGSHNESSSALNDGKLGKILHY
ncbi:hypothetical protein MTR67_017480 [Solanum verrucosum]|uniref:Uncharacterized protein n=1 Tax=Solanum verrucosum TaxID=315347 RepID=A0AAF0QKJ7_SOLVR|nr:hypothetical protein MTR67_017480 [Solanum verrucosum]